jgi:protein SDA1
MNKHHQNNKINQELRKFIGNHLQKNSDKTAQKSIKLMIELYRKNIWTDNRTVNIIADGCFNNSDKIKLLASYFLITTTEALEEIEDSEDSGPETNPNEIKFKKGIVKHTKFKEKQVAKEKRRAERRIRKKEIWARKKNFMPIDLIYNPQVFVEKLFNIMTSKHSKFAHKVVYMSLIARLIWRHQLIVLPFYRSIIKFLEPKQKDVHKILTYFAESVHDLVPEDEI